MVIISLFGDYKYMEKKEVLAIFDFDKTITVKDSLIDFTIYSFGLFTFMKGIVLLIPILIKWKLGLTSNNIVKEKYFTLFFKNIENDKFNNMCKRYCEKKLTKILNKDAIEKIKWHKEMQHHLIIISASMENWISPWAERNGFEKVIGTIPEIANDKLTGLFIGKNCYGVEKYDRLKKLYDINNYKIYVYTDSMSDRPIMDLAEKKYYRNF
ncbi:MAG: HAD-IB family hydrolase [bacterium]